MEKSVVYSANIAARNAGVGGDGDEPIGHALDVT